MCLNLDSPLPPRRPWVEGNGLFGMQSKHQKRRPRKNVSKKGTLWCQILSFVLGETGSQCYTSECEKPEYLSTSTPAEGCWGVGGANLSVFLVPLWARKTLVGGTEKIPQAKWSKYWQIEVRQICTKIVRGRGSGWMKDFKYLDITLIKGRLSKQSRIFFFFFNSKSSQVC